MALALFVLTWSFFIAGVATGIPALRRYSIYALVVLLIVAFTPLVALIVGAFVERLKGNSRE